MRLLYPNLIALRFAAVFAILRVVTVVAAMFLGSIALFVNRDLLLPALILIGLAVSLIVVSFAQALTLKCVLCRCGLFMPRTCSKHPKVKSFLGSRVLEMSLDILFGTSFRCQHCGERCGCRGTKKGAAHAPAAHAGSVQVNLGMRDRPSIFNTNTPILNSATPAAFGSSPSPFPQPAPVQTAPIESPVVLPMVAPSAITTSLILSRRHGACAPSTSAPFNPAPHQGPFNTAAEPSPQPQPAVAAPQPAVAMVPDSPFRSPAMTASPNQVELAPLPQAEIASWNQVPSHA